MTLNITLPPDAEQQLRERAALENMDEESMAATVLIQALELEAQDRQEAAAGIQQGLDDFVAGRFRRFDEFAAEQRQKYCIRPEV